MQDLLLTSSQAALEEQFARIEPRAVLEECFRDKG
jgi:hypothetical protein